MVLSALDGVEKRREPAPRFPGPMGRFFRQYVAAARQLAALTFRQGLEVRADGAVSGRSLEPIELTSLTPVHTKLKAELHGPTAHLTTLCEELGSVLDLTLWLGARTASTVHRIISREGVGGAVRLAGDFRWTPPSRLTPGEADVSAAIDPPSWQGARCLKATADDLGRTPHALEYAPDFRLGQPGLKCFRTFCVAVSGDRAQVLPGVKPLDRRFIEPTRLDLTGVGEGISICLASREPWDDRWTIVDSTEVSEPEALRHAIEWLDFRSELQDEGPADDADLYRLRHALGTSGIRTELPNELRLERRLLKPARELLAILRGVDSRYSA